MPLRTSENGFSSFLTEVFRPPGKFDDLTYDQLTYLDTIDPKKR